MRKIDLSNIKKWNTAKETAAMLRMSPRRVQRLCQQGRFPGSEKAGATWIIYLGSIQAYLRSPPRPPGRPRRRPGGADHADCHELIARSNAAAGPNTMAG